ncbi:hypothetical protein [Nocardioides iriomotensis]|uniref:Uncharacterized protein n=1 Tax=Nocardioides iriomotensis TaxID=715784 RepID=A0A4Q5JAM6_9ACTN|nr:hypothetical protein [Nocardioides iriomotensis]RYU14805.1 hypothetical protein ETU37_02110 [Nocardioides iriomotensis]
MIFELEQAAARRSLSIPNRQTMKSRISRWENGHAAPDEFYRQLLREAFGLDDRELGLEERSDDEPTAADDLRMRLLSALESDGCLIEALRSQTDAIRIQDRQFGAGLLLEVVRGHVASIDQHLGHAVFEVNRRALAEQLADAGALAGWQALDVGGLDQAWRFFELASAAALRANDFSMFAFARLEQAHIVHELAGAHVAARLAESIWTETRRRVSEPVRCWMAAAVAELQAEEAPASSRRMLAKAESLVDATDSAPAYVVLDRAHLSRWRGHTLVQMRDPAAEAVLLEAESEMHPSFIRAAASLNLDLAAAQLQRGGKDEAAERSQRATELARRVGSRRILARLEALRVAS